MGRAGSLAGMALGAPSHCELSTRSVFSDADFPVVANNERVVLEEAPVDALFAIRTTEEEEIESRSDLERLQQELSEAGLQIARLPAAQRRTAEEARELVQAKLDTAKQLFDDQSRGALTGQAFSAKLKSL